MHICFVIPRFGEEIHGGIERLVRDLAVNLAARGEQITVLTTNARDNRTFAPELAAGETIDKGIRVIRFAVDERNLDLWVPLQIRVADGQKLTLDEQFDWLRGGVNSAALYKYLAANLADYDRVITAPYLFPITFFASFIAAQKTLLIPCLHDEHYAYLDVVRAMFSVVGGVLFNAAAERRLAERIFGRLNGQIVGMGFEESSRCSYAGNSRFGQYLLYLGRKETGKGAHELIDLFVRLKDKGLYPELKLVIAGAGSFSDLERPLALERGDVIDVPSMGEEDKLALIDNCLALVQPSRNESFSIVIMEAWLRKKPVLVHGYCDVTREHVVASSGGLYFSSFLDFVGCISKLVGDPNFTETISNNGYSYVNNRYSWPAVLARFYDFLDTH